MNRVFSFFAVLLLGVTLVGVPVPARAISSADCNPATADTMNKLGYNAGLSEMNRLFSKLTGPPSFNGLYCGSINDGFSSLNSLLSGSIFSSLVNNLLRSIMSQACQAALQPIQNLLSNLCIPNFSLNYSFNFGLGNANYCSGIQLLSVSPTYNSPTVTLPGYQLTPLNGNP